jgi:SAM-dependent methyltransferase
MTALKSAIRRKYGRPARTSESCCGSGASCSDPITTGNYSASDARAIARGPSLGCGNPVALAGLRRGETVLDLGSGAGLDVLLSARAVGPTGRVFGLDMTDDMLALARANALKARASNVVFLKGEIESIPLPDASVDVVLSNCVINLSTDKPRALREAFRVLKPGGRLAVHDIVTKGAVPPRIRRSVEAWIGCVAGALDEDRYRRLLARAGFRAVSIKPTRIYSTADGIDAAANGVFRSAFVRARKP